MKIFLIVSKAFKRKKGIAQDEIQKDLITMKKHHCLVENCEIHKNVINQNYSINFDNSFPNKFKYQTARMSVNYPLHKSYVYLSGLT